MPQLIRFYHNDINLYRLRVKGGIVCACVRGGGGGGQIVELQKGGILKFSNEASRVFQILLLNNSFSSALPPRPPFPPPRPAPPQKRFCDSDAILAKLSSGEEQLQTDVF